MSDVHADMETQRRTIAAMIRIFCRRRHGSGTDLCPACSELLEYALERLERCPFQEGKPWCSRCPVHCYRPDMRRRIGEVMRYAGPRMLYRRPFLALAHYLAGRRGG